MAYFEGLWEERSGGDGTDLVSMLANGEATKDMPTTKDCKIRDSQILEGDQVLMWYISANRDEDVFVDADRIDLDRSNTDRQLSFGYGIHFCMGSRMAELQLRVLWEEVLARFERIEVQAEPERTLSSFVDGYTKLPVTVTRR